MARYGVEFRRSADKDLRRIAATTQRRVLRAIDAYRIRVGDYRVIYTVHDAVLIVAIERARHRREVYRR